MSARDSVEYWCLLEGCYVVTSIQRVVCVCFVFFVSGALPSPLVRFLAPSLSALSLSMQIHTEA